MHTVNIDGEVIEVELFGVGYPMIKDGNRMWYVFQDREAAGQAAREHWEDMAFHERDEFVLMVGADNLVSWCLGEYAGPGQEKVKSLDEWFDVVADHPEEEFASYDGEERYGTISKSLMEEIGFDSKDVVFYRHN